jgi:hypothetical protein
LPAKEAQDRVLLFAHWFIYMKPILFMQEWWPQRIHQLIYHCAFLLLVGQFFYEYFEYCKVWQFPYFLFLFYSNNVITEIEKMEINKENKF